MNPPANGKLGAAAAASPHHLQVTNGSIPQAAPPSEGMISDVLFQLSTFSSGTENVYHITQ